MWECLQVQWAGEEVVDPLDHDPDPGVLFRSAVELLSPALPCATFPGRFLCRSRALYIASVKR